MRMTVLIAALWAPAALADCPVAGDLEAGLRFSTSDGNVEVLEAFTPGVVASFYYEAGTLDSRVLLAQGIYMIEYMPYDGTALEASARDTYIYEHSPQDMPVPTTGDMLTLPVTVNEGGELSRATDVFVADAETTITFGDCSYRMLPIRMYFDTEDQQTYDILNYLPELGVAYLAQSFYPDGSDTYDYTTLEVVN
ncbi:hypothetical protein ACN2XU_07150 [Primorskyibacter sp. 2E107]|uniref:hypothetical protein n=1 Tax=Primorskyibacter sp. 2E107 TaxID=3403458 RepID=UPI003AF5AB0C